MEFDELLVTTKVDALVRLVKEKGSIELSIAARLLGVEPENVEEWGHTLEEAGIVKIDYRLTKAYLAWIPPTEEEVVKESEKLKKDKSDVAQEISLLQQQMLPKAKELEGLRSNFQEIYSKLAPKIEKLQTQLEAVSSPKSEAGKELDVSNEAISGMEKQLSELSDSMINLKDELSETRRMLKDKTPVESKFHEVDGVKKDLSELGDRLKSVDERISSLQKSLPKEKMDRDTVQKSLEPLKKDIAEFKRSNAHMRENLLSIKEAFEVLGTMDKSVNERAEHIHSLKDELQRLLASLKDVQSQGTRLTEEVRHELSSIEGYSESMEFVKTAFERFPSQKDVLKRMEELEAHEKSLEDKITALEKDTSAATLPQISIEELLELKQELDQKRKMIAEEVQELFAAVEQESSTYSTFQKIKEKAVESLDAYDKIIARINGQMSALDGQIAKARQSIDGELQRMKGSVDDKALAELIKNAREVEEKKAVLDEVAESLEALSTASENITKKLNLLARQAEILAIRTSGPAESGSGGGRVQIQPGYRKEVETAATEVPAPKEEDVRQQLYLTKGEQVEFDRKREELRQLIKKLWEQDN